MKFSRFLDPVVFTDRSLLLFAKIWKSFDSPGEMFNLLQVAANILLVVTELALELFYLGLDPPGGAVHLANAGHPLEKFALRIINQPAAVLVVIKRVLEFEKIKTNLALDKGCHLEIPPGDLLLSGQLQNFRIVGSEPVDLPVNTQLAPPLLAIAKNKIDLDAHELATPMDQALERALFRHLCTPEEREENGLAYRALAGLVGADDSYDAATREARKVQPGKLHEVLGIDGSNDHPSSPSPPSSCRASSCPPGSPSCTRASASRSLAISKPLDKRSSCSWLPELFKPRARF